MMKFNIEEESKEQSDDEEEGSSESKYIDYAYYKSFILYRKRKTRLGNGALKEK